MFLGANIDAAKEAARFGSTEDHATNYHDDKVGTSVILDADYKKEVSKMLGEFEDATLRGNDSIEELILNPWGDSLYLGKEDIGMILTPGRERFI